MNKIIFKLFFITVSGILLFLYIFPWSNYGIEVPFAGKDYKLGLDLQGGIELDYKVDLDEAKKDKEFNQAKEKDIIEGLKAIIDKRIETLKISDSVITSADYAGEKHIIVQIPLKGNNSLENSENIKKAKEAIGKVVKIEFKEERNKITPEDIKERKEIAENGLNKALSSSSFGVISAELKDSYENVYVGSLSGTVGELNKYFSLSGANYDKGVFNKLLSGTGKETIGSDGKNNLTTIAGDKGYYIIDISDIKKSENNSSTGEIKKGNIISLDYIFVSEKPSQWMSAKDKNGRILNDKYFVKSGVQYNEAFQPMVELTFNDEGAKIFAELTKRLSGKQIAIFVGGELLTAPNVNEPILNGKAVITGTYSPDEAKKLSQNINTGVVPAPIYLTSEKTIDSRLGASSLEKLLIAGGIGFLLIFGFLLYVYRISGLMASIALVLYAIIVLAIVKFFSIVLTLASIAGLILSVGMAIDANILVFERVREELNGNSKSLTDAINIGFDKSWSAIWDSNLTGLIVSIILFVFGINMIKGFGLMLAIGIIVSLFSVMWISRILIIIFAKFIKNKDLFIGK